MKLQTYYSKPSLDIQKEETRRSADERTLIRKQKRATAYLKKRKFRTRCILCARSLRGEHFTHRGLCVVRCGTCGHVQSTNMPPRGYPFIKEAGYSYTSIYPKLTPAQYRDRKNRIYAPKLEWILSSLTRADYSRAKLRNMKWVEIGSGAGYFLSALKTFGVKNYLGIDADAKLVGFTESALGEGTAIVSDQCVGESIRKHAADIYVAFFVFEHIEDLSGLIQDLRTLPKGTILIFSVPLYGFSCLLEQAFPERYARNFDMAMHTHVFTDTSIRYLLQQSGFRKISEWLFGQDAMDLARFLSGNTTTKALGSSLIRSIDGIQHVLDINRLADQQHILAIKI